jgi:hypothetical protein
MGRESMRVEESPTTPELAKGPSATRETDGCGSLGQEVGAQGALCQPEWPGVANIPETRQPRYVG